MNAKTFTKHLVLVIAACCAATVCASAAEPPDPSRAEIGKALKLLEQALAHGTDAKTVSKMLYAEQDLLVGEGEEGATRGMTATMADVQGWYDSLGPGGTKRCRYTIEDPVVSSNTTFTSFILLRCEANPPVLPQAQELRMMYAWKKFPAGWRVVLEMWAPGKM